MEIDMLKYFLTQGPFAALFVWLLIYVMKTNKEREKNMQEENREREGRLQALLDKFSEKYDLIIGEIRDMKERLPRDKGE
ncbi:BhlA/UviB family holin-like peptide [Paenibacillus alvei]|uniref:BhlA/UviB family holin-like peptide n=1 Tax=Paenibacillus alvei TaxID=44250 RepID=UPI0018CCF342|nr:BhlA/UviB family holin-like peptide [Paenibacillus alvei]MBG9735820.1 bhlA [Paenibacillus alvei]MBG9736130.1 bhlA [Paenibacillus alvei]MBG9736310.1 bhlA [Paenibacillus alvei]MBG9737281.1 bhlA [Paenibacillus alvei]MBG9743257.1 bhlA [Paenibacillus alvei]